MARNTLQYRNQHKVLSSTKCIKCQNMHNLGQAFEAVYSQHPRPREMVDANFSILLAIAPFTHFFPDLRRSRNASIAILSPQLRL